MTSLNVHIYPSPFRHESRMLKITKSLADAGVFRHIVVIATWKEGLPHEEAIDEVRSVRRVERKWGRNKGGTLWKALATFEWSVKVFRQLRREKISCLNCHSLSVLPLSVMLKFATGCKLIYDTHELETEVAGAHGIRKKLSKILERTLIRFSDHIIVVNDAIADWYRDTYQRSDISVVKNVPYQTTTVLKKTHFLRNEFRIADDEIVFLYQGLLGYGRGIEILLDVFSGLGRDKHIVFMGYGTLEARVRELASSRDNIHYKPAVLPEQVAMYTAGADVGVSIIENASLSYYLSLPNKVFEYLNGGLPVIVSDFPVVGAYIDSFGCGWKVVPDMDAVRHLIEELTWDEIGSNRAAALASQEHFGWELEELALLAVYTGLGFDFSP